METIIAMILAGITVAFVGYPLLKANPEVALQPEAEETTVEEELENQKAATFAAIGELDFDHAMGNLSDRDHEELRDRYKLKALTLMKEMDELAKSTPRHPAPVATPQAVAERGNSQRFCSGCGAGLDRDDRFCRQCGRPLSSGCSVCGTLLDPTDAFCANCGRAVR